MLECPCHPALWRGWHKVSADARVRDGWWCFVWEHTILPLIPPPSIPRRRRFLASTSLSYRIVRSWFGVVAKSYQYQTSSRFETIYSAFYLPSEDGCKGWYVYKIKKGCPPCNACVLFQHPDELAKMKHDLCTASRQFSNDRPKSKSFQTPPDTLIRRCRARCFAASVIIPHQQTDITVSIQL
jgi:hypothetical protein